MSNADWLWLIALGFANVGVVVWCLLSGIYYFVRVITAWWEAG